MLEEQYERTEQKDCCLEMAEDYGPDSIGGSQEINIQPQENSIGVCLKDDQIRKVGVQNLNFTKIVAQK